MIFISLSVIERSKTEDRLHWDWKLMFKKISGDITQAVEASIMSSMNTYLHEEWEQWQTYHTLTQIQVKHTLPGGKNDYPKVITKVNLPVVHCYYMIKIREQLLKYCLLVIVQLSLKYCPTTS